LECEARRQNVSAQRSHDAPGACSNRRLSAASIPYTRCNNIWHDVLTTSDRAKADELKNKLGDKARVLDRGMAMS
jgi:hypothetical protein